MVSSFRFTVTGLGSGQGKFHLESDSSTQAGPPTPEGCEHKGSICRISDPNYKRSPSSEEFKVKEKAAHFAWRALLCPSHASHLREKLMTLTRPIRRPRRAQLRGTVPAGPRGAARPWPGAADRTGRAGAGRATPALRAFSSSSLAANGRARSAGCHGNGKTARQCPEQMSHGPR